MLGEGLLSLMTGAAVLGALGIVLVPDREQRRHRAEQRAHARVRHPSSVRARPAGAHRPGRPTSPSRTSR